MFSTVTADQALIVAKIAAPHLKKGAFWFDLNSCAPSSKQLAAKEIEARDVSYLDVAVMGAVDAKPQFGGFFFLRIGAYWCWFFRFIRLHLVFKLLASTKHDAGGVGDGRCSHCVTDIYTLTSPRQKSPPIEESRIITNQGRGTAAGSATFRGRSDNVGSDGFGRATIRGRIRGQG